METLWIGGPDDVRTGDAALDAIRQENDAHYYDPTYGITRVTLSRWQKAQHYEMRGWLQCWADQTDDRSDVHMKTFNNYEALKQNLGNVCEIGCGPFTQLKTIIQGRTASRVTLLDPLLHSYRNMANCTYKNGKFMNFPTILRNEMAESFTDFALYDTIICINVLEHVMDAPKVMENLKRALKAGGVLVFGERAYDGFDPHYVFDMGHPIHVKRPFLDGFRKYFQVLFSNENYFIGVK